MKYLKNRRSTGNIRSMSLSSVSLKPLWPFVDVCGAFLVLINAPLLILLLVPAFPSSASEVLTERQLEDPHRRGSIIS